MKTLFKYSLVPVILLFAFGGCKTTKNTFVHRGYHNLTARFNGYYYATESIKEGEDKIRTTFKYDYDRLLPVYLVPTNETAKATFPEFDKAIKKSSNCIQRHTIKDKKGNEIPKAGKWIDNNWNVIGISHFYKREFFSGIEAFEYVIRTYKTPDRYKAMVWLARSYNEIGAVSQAEPIVGLLKDDKKISKYGKKELPALQADYFLRRGMYKEAEKALIDAIKAKPSKKTRARYAFILGQMFEEKNDPKKAREYYQKTISAKPDYDLVFHAKMKQARLVDLKYGNTAKVKHDLIKMTRDEKNSEYLDIIYYTLGEIYEREKNEDIAVVNYKLSVSNSTQNPKQKALSYLKLGEISFERANYVASGAYYDSTMITLPKEYKDYDVINKRKQTLETLVGYIRTIQREDSLQRVAKMSDKQREQFITKMIQNIEDEEERKKEALAALQDQNNNSTSNTGNPTGMTDLGIGTKGDWYFYNPNLVAFGLNDFIKKWGNRKLEDNWRRSQKAITFEDPTASEKDTIVSGKDSVAVKKKAKSKDKKSIDFYLKDLPLTDTLMQVSNTKIIDAYYNLGSTYKEDLNNNKKAIATFEDLNKRYTVHKFRPSTYFQLYKIYTSVNNKPKAEEYKNKLLNEFPSSEYAQLIKNPNYEAEKKSQKGEVELFYTETFDKYAAGNYTEAYSLSKESETKFGKNDFSPKFAFIKAMCIGKLKGADSLDMALKTVQALYPKDPVTKEAQDLIEVLYNLKHPSEATNNAAGVNLTDTFTLNLKAKHFVIAVFADDAEIGNTFKAAVSDFDITYYGISNLIVESSLFGTTEQIVYVKSFENAENAMKYISNLGKDKTVFSGKVKRELFTIMAISEDNIQKLFRKKKVSYYKPFFDDHYK